MHLPFSSAEAVEAAFYQAFENADLDAMLALWADSEEVSCIHPLGDCLRGREAVSKSWRQVLSDSRQVRFELSDLRVCAHDDLAIHTLRENITLVGSSKRVAPLLSTNIYLRTAQGWRILMRHTSLFPDVSRANSAPKFTPVLH